MKIMKLNKITLLTFIASAFMLTSCVDDDLDGLDAQPKPTATTSVTALTVLEGQSDVIPFTLSRALSVPSQFKIELVGGSGTQDDISSGDQDTDADTGIPHVGFEITVPAYVSTFDIPVSAMLDTNCESDENIQLKITAAGVRTAITPSSNGYLIDLTIPNVPTWKIVGNDSYGDGWNGASIDVTVDGTTTSYAVEGDTEEFFIPIPTGSTYSFAFSSGDWDGEITYEITDPNGNVFNGGPSPAVGEITSGTSNGCSN